LNLESLYPRQDGKFAGEEEEANSKAENDVNGEDGVKGTVRHLKSAFGRRRALSDERSQRKAGRNESSYRERGSQCTRGQRARAREYCDEKEKE
jgi:hypothetical protein